MPIQVSKKEFIEQHPMQVWKFVRSPAEKLKPHFPISFETWFYNADSELDFFLQNKCYSSVTEKVSFQGFFYYFFLVAIEFILKKKNTIQSLHYFTNFSNWYENVASFLSSGTFKNGLKYACFWTINFVQGLGVAQAVWKPTFSIHYRIGLKKRIS